MNTLYLMTTVLHFFSESIMFVQAAQRLDVLPIFQMISMYTNQIPLETTSLQHQLLHTLVLVEALSQTIQPPPVPAYLLEPVVALKVITQPCVATMLLLNMPLLL